MMRRAHWSRGEIERYRDKQLRMVVKYAYDNSRFYHERFRKIGVKPEGIKTVGDLNKLPIVRKEDVVKNLRDVVSVEYDIAKLRVQRTSGSTGRPLYVYMTQAENEFRKAKHLRAQMVLGQKPWHKWVTITSPLHFAETTRLQKIFKFYSVTPISVFDDVKKQVSEIQKLKPDVIDGYSNSLLLLAKEIEKTGIDDVRPKFLVGGAELISPPSRSYIEKVFEAPLYDQYATVEFERIAWQCREKAEYHIDADSVIVQFVDENGEEVAPGERGEIVCTSLFNYAMPFIRYALDDVGIPSEKAECPCGISFPLMKLIEGRKTSLLSFSNGRVLAPFALMLAIWTFKHYDLIDTFRVIQTKRDNIVFKLKLKKYDAKVEEIRRELTSHVRKELKLNSDDVSIDVEFLDDIPLDKTGKFSIVISEVCQDDHLQEG
jgi:phenylacetate-CoA ligase